MKKIQCVRFWIKKIQRVRFCIEKFYNQSDFELKVFHLLWFWLKIFTTRQILKRKNTTRHILNLKFYNNSDFDVKFFHLSFWTGSFTTYQVLIWKFFARLSLIWKILIIPNIKLQPSVTTCTLRIVFLRTTINNYSLQHPRLLDNINRHRLNKAFCTRFRKDLHFWFRFGVPLFSLYKLNICRNLLLLIKMMITVPEMLLPHTFVTCFWKKNKMKHVN